MAEPSIKGLLVTGFWQRIHDLLDDGLCSEEEIEVRLEARDLEILDRKIEPTLWYPVDSLRRYADLLSEMVGPPDRRELHERGQSAALTVLTSPTYITYLEMARQRPDAVASVIAGVGSMLFNFGHWRVKGTSASHCTITFEGVGLLPEPVRFQLEGVVAAIVRDVDGERVWIRSARPHPDRMVFSCEPE